MEWGVKRKRWGRIFDAWKEVGEGENAPQSADIIISRLLPVGLTFILGELSYEYRLLLCVCIGRLGYQRAVAPIAVLTLIFRM